MVANVSILVRSQCCLRNPSRNDGSLCFQSPTDIGERQQITCNLCCLFSVFCRSNVGNTSVSCTAHFRPLDRHYHCSTASVYSKQDVASEALRNIKSQALAFHTRSSHLDAVAANQSRERDYPGEVASFQMHHCMRKQNTKINKPQTCKY